MATKSPRPARKAAPVKKTAKRPASTKRAPKPAPAPEPTGSKQSQLISLLSSPAGATVDQMTALTGWQPHTVRGAISGVLRKRLKLVVTCAAGTDGIRVYRIGAA
jgi:Protein of unknown function (DUF3489)